MTAGPVVESLIENYPSEFVVVRYHVNPPTGGTDPYETTWGSRRASEFYSIWINGSVPWFAYDGLFEAGPDDSTYESNLQAELAIPTDVTVSIVGQEVSANTYDITTEVCIDSGGEGKTLRVYTVQLLDHYPPDQNYYRNTFMQAADTQDVTVAAGACAQVVRTFTFDATSMAQIDDVKIVAWAQEPLNAYPAEVYQAAESPYPFVDLSLFSDGFESGDVSFWSDSNP